MLVRTYWYYTDDGRMNKTIRKAISTGQFSMALELCEERVPKRPHDSQLLWLEAEVLFRMGELEKAREKFENLLLHEPSWKEDAEKFITAIESKT
jgi:Flp pilus assembly protein TadD